MLGVDPSYNTPPASAELSTQQYMQHSVSASPSLESPQTEVPPPLNLGGSLKTPHTNSPTPMRPPPQPRSNSLPGSPTQDDARRALEVVLTFCQHQRSGLVDQQESMAMGKLMEKLRLQAGGYPGNLQCIPEQEVVMGGDMKYPLRASP